MSKDAITITLSLPDKLLHPNGGRGNRHAVHRVGKAAHQRAYYETLAALNRADWSRSTIIRLQYDFFVNSKAGAKLSDKDNSIASMKKYQDGIAAAMEINDRAFPVAEVTHDYDGTPRVVVTITRKH